MLIMVKNNYPVTLNPQLSRVWIKTGNPKLPLKSVWIDEAKLRVKSPEFLGAGRESETNEVAEDPSLLAA